MKRRKLARDQSLIPQRIKQPLNSTTEFARNLLENKRKIKIYQVPWFILSMTLIDLLVIDEKKSQTLDPDVIWTRNLLIWSQTRYRCATESCSGSYQQKTKYKQRASIKRNYVYNIDKT